MLRPERAEVGGGSMKVSFPTLPPSRGTLTLVSGIEFRMRGWDAISNVRSLSFSPGLKRVTNPGAQITFWPTPRGSFFVADPHAIKVRGCRIDFQNSIVADQWPLTVTECNE